MAINVADLDKIWEIIEKTADYSTEEEYKSYVDAVNKGHDLVGDCSDLSGLSPDQSQRSRKIAELFEQLG